MHGTCFVSRKGGRNYRRKEKSRKEFDERGANEELPGRHAQDSVITDALRRRKFFFFHARGSPYPHVSAGSQGDAAFPATKPW